MRRDSKLATELVTGHGEVEEEAELEPVRVSVLKQRADIMFSGKSGAVGASGDGEATSAPTYGLCKDEYGRSGHWPFQMYVRVALRMVSELVLTEKDVVTSVFKDRSDSIGLGSCKRQDVSESRL